MSVLMALTVFATVLTSMTVSHIRQTVNDSARTEAYYIAHSVAISMRDWVEKENVSTIENYFDNIDDGRWSQWHSFGRDTDKEYRVNAKIVKKFINGDGSYFRKDLRITAEGRAGEQTSQVMVEMIPKRYIPGIDFGQAIIALHGLNLKENVEIDSGFKFNTIANKDNLTIGSGIKVGGDSYVGEGTADSFIKALLENNSIKGEVKTIIPSSYIMPAFPQMPEGLGENKDLTLSDNQQAVISNDSSYNQIVVNDNGELIVKVGEEGRAILVNNLVVHDNGRIKLEKKVGANTMRVVKVYLENQLDINDSGVIGQFDNKDNLIIYYAGSETFSPEGDLNGSIYSNSADILLLAGNIAGNIISGGNITVKGSMSGVKIIYATSLVSSIRLLANMVLYCGEYMIMSRKRIMAIYFNLTLERQAYYLEGLIRGNMIGKMIRKLALN